MGDAAGHDEVSCDLPLTTREWEIARLVAVGLSNREIAQRLGISTATVHNHLIHIYDKLGVRGRVQLALWVANHQANPSSKNEPIGS
jgi:non-specific serine/threonine protein kinase